MSEVSEYRGKSCRGEERIVEIFPERDAKLTDFGKATLKDRYLLPGETFQTMFARVACAYSTDSAHAQRLYDGISKLWFMPATPVLSNGGTDRGLPISCFLNSVEDSLEGISETWTENLWLAARGGGIGTYWGNVRSIGERVGGVGETSGIVPFIKVQDSMTLGISQGSLRRGSAAVYLDVDHPEIEEFIRLRDPTGGDPNRKCLNIHHGVNITDAFMEAVRDGADWELKSPRTGEVLKVIKARDLWQKMLMMRMKTGEPYMLFIDTVQRQQPEHQRKLGLLCRQSNLCSEITLPTGRDHLGNERTAVCCLTSLNLETYFEWQNNRQFLKDVLLFADRVLQDFIDRTAGVEGFEKARYSAIRERSIGVGVMGWQSFLQSINTPFEGAMAKSWNKKIFTWLKQTGDEINHEVAKELGCCPDSFDAHCQDNSIPLLRWSNMYSVAPTASISIICGTTSPGIEPFSTNVFTQKTLSGSFTVRNQYLDKLLREIAETSQTGFEQEQWVKDQWDLILNNEGSVQNLPYLDDYQKAVFKTAFEIDQRWVIEHAADRAPLICQAASNNLFLRGDADVRDIHFIHFQAWKKGLKSLYYCRSMAVSRAGKVSHMAGEMPMPEQAAPPTKYDECLACQ
jgi:ribonucleoside-diphosphate reductase alpha chain